MRYFPALAVLLVLLSPLACIASSSETPPLDRASPQASSAPPNFAGQLPTTLPLEQTAFAPTPSPTEADSGWQMLHQGLERRVIQVAGENGLRVEYLFILRIDPAFYAFDVAYDPKAPRALDAWQAATCALVVVNGGYFSTDEQGRYSANGLVIVNGKKIGSSYGPFAGMLAISAGGPQLRWLQAQPYSRRERLLAGLQSFPLLVKPGGRLGFPAQYEDNLKARRTVIGQDSEGRILLLVAPLGHYTLHQLSLALLDLDLGLDIALNLDGGPSSGIILAEPYEYIPAYSLLPLVIVVQPR
ncbi:MAG: phosphodiester glycosidase family protein [Anaerolineales bacterium]|nr:phosphodiester glycosidase family protein [Anaerolineales bacterium]